MSTPSFQSGITNRPPERALVVAFDLAGADPTANQTTLGSLRELTRRELRSDLDEQDANTPKDQPSPETGELGFRDGYDRAHLTVTLGLGKSAFEKLGVPPEQHPQDLVPVPWGQLGDATVLKPTKGDIVVQVCNDDVYVCEHVIRRIEEELGAGITLVWAQLGAARVRTGSRRCSPRPRPVGCRQLGWRG